MAYIIKKATEEDINEDVINIQLKAYRFHQKERPDVFDDLPDEKLIRGYKNVAKYYDVLLVIDEGKTVGLLTYEIKSLTDILYLYIEEIYIEEEYRGKGYAKALLEEAKKIAKENKCQRIELTCWTFNENAIKMYNKLGYKEQKISYEMIIN